MVFPLSIFFHENHYWKCLNGVHNAFGTPPYYKRAKTFNGNRKKKNNVQNVSLRRFWHQLMEELSTKSWNLSQKKLFVVKFLFFVEQKNKSNMIMLKRKKYVTYKKGGGRGGWYYEKFCCFHQKKFEKNSCSFQKNFGLKYAFIIFVEHSIFVAEKCFPYEKQKRL